MLKPVLDVDSIIKEYGGSMTQLNPIVLEAIMTGMMDIQKGCGSNVKWTEFHFSMKSGPMGPAFLSAIREIPLILHQQRPNIETLGGSGVTS